MDRGAPSGVSVIALDKIDGRILKSVSMRREDVGTIYRGRASEIVAALSVLRCAKRKVGAV